ncbi:hypothetical protein GCM10011495_06730 [Hymenobacter frigidus]|uniref:GIY-YIG domain-containing protein n=1 Tax=Hymenobacter frigidus TaxID=1524095 RepID=A0ABQ1ZZ18_9BACT|nr:hypothetical protein [Hymenobacter frigidus]GGH80867.1 hypothetical protein GCM10011495_06730 [Hymenobacter frigidus]
MTPNPEFDKRIARLPALFHELMAQPLYLRSEIFSRERIVKPDVPTAGNYVFYENGLPMYVGRSRRLRSRLQEHGRDGSGHNDANFAFLLAYESATDQNIDITRTRAALSDCTEFSPVFLACKRRVAAMSVRFLSVPDDLEQGLLEVYAALALPTRYNDFQTS